MYFLFRVAAFASILLRLICFSQRFTFDHPYCFGREKRNMLGKELTTSCDTRIRLVSRLQIIEIFIVVGKEPDDTFFFQAVKNTFGEFTVIIDTTKKFKFFFPPAAEREISLSSWAHKLFSFSFSFLLCRSHVVRGHQLTSPTKDKEDRRLFKTWLFHLMY